MKPRALIFSVAYFPFVGGAEVAVKELTDRLKQFDFDLITVNLDGKQKPVEQIGQVKVYRLGRGTVGKFLYPWRAAWLAARLHNEHIFSFTWSIMANYAGLAAVRFKRRYPAVPFLLTLQEGDDLTEVECKVRWIASWWRDIFRRADYIQAISHYLAAWAKRMMTTCPIGVVPNGVDLSKFQTLSTKLQRQEKIIITTSRLVYKNGIDDLIRALQFLPADIKLQVVGTGPDGEKLKILAQELGLERRVDFVGHVNPAEVPQFLGRADVFARPSRSEGLGNSFLEAMAAGLPTIGTPVGGIPDFLTNGETGWFCEVDDPKGLAEKIKYILDPANADVVSQVKENARQMVNEKYDWDKIAVVTEELLDRLVKNR